MEKENNSAGNAISKAVSEIHYGSIGYAPQASGIRKYRNPPRRAQCAFDDRRLSKVLLRYSWQE